MLKNIVGVLASSLVASTFLSAEQARAAQDAQSPGEQNAANPAPATSDPLAPTTQTTLAPVVVTSKAKRLNEARTGIQTQTGASVYTVDSAAIAAMPGGDNAQLNQVLLQTPDVAQDSFGQFHVRGEHADLQYRLDGIILPEGIAVFGQSLDPRLISSVALITGALPAEYGLRTTGVIDITTKSAALEPGGSVSVYGGSHGTFQPSINYAGALGDWNYFVSGDFLSSDLGIESPDGSSNPLHDHTHQRHGFAYAEDVLDASNRLSVGLGSSVGSFEIPNLNGQQASLGLNVNGQSSYPSADLNENQREVTQFGFISFQHSDGPLDIQTSIVNRYSSLTFTPDPLGDLLYNGISQYAYKRDDAWSVQSDAAYKLSATHTLRLGIYLQRDASISQTASQVLPFLTSSSQYSSTPITIDAQSDQAEWIESLYVQDEWAIAPTFTLNYGARFDNYDAFSSGHQLSPRLNAVWKATASTTVHAGYSRYFSPPPFELVGSEAIAQFANTSAAPAVSQNSTPQAERADYLDFGVDQAFGRSWTAGVDSYYKYSHNLIDEGQFGAPIILTPFNYAQGLQYGLEFKLNYAGPRLSAYANLALQNAKGKDIDSAQFNFSAADLAYIANHYIDLDHEQHVTASAGTSYLYKGTRLSLDAILGSGLRADEILANGEDIPNGAHLPFYTQVNFGASHKFYLSDASWVDLRFDVINVFDRVYEIRNGTGVGVGAPQFGPRRGFFVGITKSL